MIRQLKGRSWGVGRPVGIACVARVAGAWRVAGAQCRVPETGGTPRRADGKGTRQEPGWQQQSARAHVGGQRGLRQCTQRAREAL